MMYFNPRAPYGARHPAGTENAYTGAISIHAPHTGRDPDAYSQQQMQTLFQSTRPIRGATAPAFEILSRHRYFNPRAPYGARRGGPGPELGACAISIHAPHTGRDCCPVVDLASFILFQSTRPIRGATRPKMPIAPPISNFNPRAPYGARPWTRSLGVSTTHFNPRAPYGARQAERLGGVMLK